MEISQVESRLNGDRNSINKKYEDLKKDLQIDDMKEENINCTKLIALRSQCFKLAEDVYGTIKVFKRAAEYKTIDDMEEESRNRTILIACRFQYFKFADDVHWTIRVFKRSKLESLGKLESFGEGASHISHNEIVGLTNSTTVNKSFIVKGDLEDSAEVNADSSISM